MGVDKLDVEIVYQFRGVSFPCVVITSFDCLVANLFETVFLSELQDFLIGSLKSNYN